MVHRVRPSPLRALGAPSASPLRASVGLLAALGFAAIASCGLNPQPEPPGETTGAGGAAGSSGAFEAGVPTGGSAGATGSGGDAATLDAGAGTTEDSDAAPDGASELDAAVDGDAADAACSIDDATLIAAQCTLLMPLPCVKPTTPEDCAVTLKGDAAQVPPACRCAFAALSACTAEHGFACPTYRSDLHRSPACAPLENAYEACLGKGDMCSAGVATDAGAALWAECDQYAAECTQPDASSPYTCTCGYGSHVGKTFTTPSLSTLEATAKTECE